MFSVLLAETDELVQGVIRLFLKELDSEVSVISVSDGQQAALAMATRHFDLAIVEARLPGASGFEVAEFATSRNLPVLLVSGHIEDQIKVEEFGFPYLSKPFGLKQLLAAMRRIRSVPEDHLRQMKTAAVRMQRPAEWSDLLLSGCNVMRNDNHQAEERAAA